MGLASMMATTRQPQLRELGPQQDDPSDAHDSSRWSVEIPPDWRVLEGHFPGAPVVPGVALLTGLVEAAAQRSWPSVVGIVELTRAKFRAPTFAGDRIELVLQLGPAGSGAPDRRDLKFSVSCGPESRCVGRALVAWHPDIKAAPDGADSPSV